MESALVKEKKITPMMEQWQKCKEKAKTAVLLFRMGDFYEAFYEDAKIIAEVLDLTLTQRQGIPMSGVPFHAADSYIDRLVAKGIKVAIAEQLEKASDTKTLVKRDIVRFITPGTIISSSLLSEKQNNYIASLSRIGSCFGLAWIDISTGSFKVIEIEDPNELINECYHLSPKEIVISKKFLSKHQSLINTFNSNLSLTLSLIQDWRFEHKIAHDFLISHFPTSYLESFGVQGMTSAINAAGGLLAYIKEELSLPTHHITRLSPEITKEYMLIDKNSHEHLEITSSHNNKSISFSLLSILDKTLTPMGGRFLKEALKKPLLSVKEINYRLEAVEKLVFSKNDRVYLKNHLSGVKDLERLIMKISTGFANPRDLITLRSSLNSTENLRKHNYNFSPSKILQNLLSKIDNMQETLELLNKAIVDSPPNKISDGDIFKKGFNPELDELKNIKFKTKEWLLNYQTTLQNQLNIKNLKISFNRIFGYYIEISKSHVDKVPPSFQRKQTRVNAERYISPELKEFENKILTAEEKIALLETNLFKELCNFLSNQQKSICSIAYAIEQLDFFYSLAEVAKQNNYTRPTVNLSLTLKIDKGRHPVIETTVDKDKFIPNDIDLNGESKRMMLITGPNMAGKSTYIRQIALLVIMAQIGSFIPANSAEIGIVDKIFTRIGANDDLSKGLSTFMVEMTETANILHNASNRSLVILDEIGRGTGTYDGLSIAWSVAEYLLCTPDKKAKSLFATHFWELTLLEEHFESVSNYHAEVLEEENNVAFLHKIVSGGTDKSYGIHVAKMAGFPPSVIKRAQEILNKLKSREEQSKVSLKKDMNQAIQLNLF